MCVCVCVCVFSSIFLYILFDHFHYSLRLYIYIYISDVLLWTPTYDRAKAGRPARTYIQQLYWGYRVWPWRPAGGDEPIGRSGERGSRISVLAARHDIYIYIYIGWLIGLAFANGPGDLGSILGRVIPKTLEMVLDTSLLNTQQYKVRIKGKLEQSGERCSVLHYTSV